MDINVRFKSTPENYLKELSGEKNNTVRKCDVNDRRFTILSNLQEQDEYFDQSTITIENSESGEEFTRQIKNVTFWFGDCIITWRS